MPSVSQKVRVLKYIAEQGIVCLEDVIDHLKSSSSASSIRVSLYQAGLGRMKYGKIKHGVWYINNQAHLDELFSYFPDMPLIPLVGILASQIPHYLELNRIRNIFDNSTNLNIISWVPESYLRAYPADKRDGFNQSNIPDAVFWRRKADGLKQKYFLEFERSLKNTSRYKDIFTTYANRSDTGHKNVLYICKDDYIKNNLQRIEQKLTDTGYLDATDKYFQFVTLDNFYKQQSLNRRNKQWINSNV